MTDSIICNMFCKVAMVRVCLSPPPHLSINNKWKNAESLYRKDVWGQSNYLVLCYPEESPGFMLNIFCTKRALFLLLSLPSLFLFWVDGLIFSIRQFQALPPKLAKLFDLMKWQCDVCTCVYV